MANRGLSRRKGKLYTCFVDLKAAFDGVKRNELQKRMEDINIGENLRKRVMEIYEKTWNVESIKERETNLKQGRSGRVVH